MFVFPDDDEPGGVRVAVELPEKFSTPVSTATAAYTPRHSHRTDTLARILADVVVPPTGIEPATFGTGNLSLLRSEHNGDRESRVIPRMSEVQERVYPCALWVHHRAHSGEGPGDGAR